MPRKFDYDSSLLDLPDRNVSKSLEFLKLLQNQFFTSFSSLSRYIISPDYMLPVVECGEKGK